MLEKQAIYQVERLENAIDRLVNIDIKPNDKLNAIRISIDTIDNTLKIVIEFNK